jgi:hypothetical protein
LSDSEIEAREPNLGATKAHSPALFDTCLPAVSAGTVSPYQFWGNSHRAQ